MITPESGMLATPPKSMDSSHLDKLICLHCGTQYEEVDRALRKNCRICDDPRDSVSPTGPAWVTLRELYSTPSPKNANEPKYRISLWTDPKEPTVTVLSTQPKFAIGQSPFVLKTPHGLVIWETMTYLDKATVDAIKLIGEVKAIAISHPHFYSTHLAWSAAFGDVPIYLPKADDKWRQTVDKNDVIRYFEGEVEIVPGCKIVQVGGHFPGSSVLEFDGKLFIADTLNMTPAALYHFNRPKGISSFSFLFSVVNSIPLPPSEIVRMWSVIKKLDFSTVYGVSQRVPKARHILRDAEMDEGEKKSGRTVKFKVLDSMRIQIRAMGYEITPEMELEL
ncbi:hypothetical protein DRE_06665 [Drechslerella stenobrocha 248]|uniref:Metallo-beta-lactamase domain-containing protein n=1 Tax=Drechslerella stenobrocha 248 TaxID=1043628 RepID=W7HN79_9PEZI|nr:hypothetical protein DRE_06665 [Drechslerella stenobrocha 248]